MIRIGTAGWAIPRQHAERFPETGTLLVRYASRFNCVEINSTFYRSHRRTTYERWAATVPHDFRFSAKMPKTITHERRLDGVEELLAAFLEEVSVLGEKLGPLLVQLPGTFEFEPERVENFFRLLRRRTSLPIVCEPRHASWFAEEATSVLLDHAIARVAADPARVSEAAHPGGWPGLVYYRLHGSPRMYFSPYDAGWIAQLAERLALIEANEVWCIFDNTGSGSAAGNALDLHDKARSST